MSGTKGQKVVINVETPMEDIVKYSDEGRSLIFRPEPGEFPDIPEDYLLRLSKKNKDSYLVSKSLHEDRMENADDEEIYADIAVGENAGNARQRLSVEDLPKNLHHRWVRPDRVGHYERRGYTVYHGKDAKTFGNQTKGARRISNMGQAEHYLMVIDKDLHKKHEKERREKKDALLKSPVTSAKREFGSSAVDEKTTSNVAFSDAVGSEETE